MATRLGNNQQAEYKLSLLQNVNLIGSEDLNDWVGKQVSIEFTGNINCVVTGKKIKKTYGEGLSYDAFISSPLGSPSIVRPELSRIHEGIALRDFEWEQQHHNQPHYVYLSRTSGVKVGVTRSTNVFSRWIDQGATEGILFAETPYRQLAGHIEVIMKKHLADKTAWQAMLKGHCTDHENLSSLKNRLLGLLPTELHDFIADSDDVHAIDYPVIALPSKPKSIKLDNTTKFNGRLLGIKGQYLLFDQDRVFNVRSHSGYEIVLSVE